MTIPELAERIEGRLVEMQQEIVRLQEAAEALAANRTDAVAAEPAPHPRSPRRALELPAPDRTSRRRAPDHPAARRASKPHAVLALALELDAGLRNRP